jgi:hypothetical protein
MMKTLGLGAEATDTKDWHPTSAVPAKPGTYINVRTVDVTTYRWLAYKKDGARQMKVAGRWQRATEYGWENAPLPGGEFVMVLEEK